jgi:HlyD family secretion protein
MAHPNPRILIPIALLTAFGVGGWYIERQRARDRSTLSGFFESQPVQVASRIGGRVAAIKVREGDSVKNGALLVTLEARANQADTAAREAQADQARAAAAEARNGPRYEEIRRQEAAVAEAQANLAKLQNGSRPEEIKAARARLEQARTQVRKLKAGARPEEIAGARAGEQTAKAKLAQAERGLTPEERAQVRARYESAAATERLAAIELSRTEGLVREGADSQQHLDRVRADLQTAQARTNEMREALRRADLGTPQEELNQAREAYLQAKAALDLVLAGPRREDVEAARQEAVAARENLQLLVKGARPEDIRAAEEKVRQAQATLDELRSGSRREQIAQARAAARAAEAQVRGSRANLSERELHAPQAGIIERILITEGDLVQPGTPVLRIAVPDDIWIRVYVPESSLARVNPGTEAILHIDGLPQNVDAVVESVATRGEYTPANLQTPDERGKQVFAVRLRLVKPDPRVKAGMFATVKRLGDQTW